MEKLQIGRGDLVTYGWYYRRQPIHASAEGFIGIVLDDPFYDHISYEKLIQRKKRWMVSDIYDFTLVATVLTNNGETLIYPVRNLIKQARKEHE